MISPAEHVMPEQRDRDVEDRVLLLAPTSRDQRVTCELLLHAGLQCIPCRDLQEVCAQIRAGCAVVLLTEESIASPGIAELIEVLKTQPAWSDLPLVMLMRGGNDSSESVRVMKMLPNVTLLERPAASRSVISAVESAVRARRRQYEARAYIDQIRQSHERYRDVQQRLEIAVSASELGTFHCAMPLNKIIWNERCKAHFWLAPDAEIDFDLFYSILHPDDRERTRQAVEDCVRRGSLYDIEYRTVSPRGEIRWLRATGRTFFDASGAPVQFDGTTQDITERKKVAEEREQLLASEQAARAESDRAGRMKDEFLATLSHELRTPLNAILGWSQLIRRERDPQTLEEGLEVIERNARVQVQLIEDLLDMSRIISGKLRLDVQTIDPSTSIIAAIETVTPAAAAKGVRIVRLLDSQAGLVAGDASRLQQIVWNLLSNAVKFTDQGGEIQVRLSRERNRVAIAVSDTGKGIDRAFVPHLFERFRQSDASTTRQHGGLGLGLSIVKQLVELHGGSITAASAGAGQGSTFTVELPAAVTHREKRDGSRARPIAAQTAGRSFSDSELDGLGVLVVDDEKDARGLVKRVLEDYGAVVTLAASAYEAMELVPTVKPDVLVSDIGMPGMDGYELLRRVRALGTPAGNVPAIALSALARSEDRARALGAGYTVHMSKPVEPHELVAVVATVGGRRART